MSINRRRKHGKHFRDIERRLHFESLESRLALAANLQALSLSLVDVDDVPVLSPIVGEQVFVRANWKTSELAASDRYVVRVSLNAVAVDSAAILGIPGENVAGEQKLGGWFAVPGTHTIRLLVDAEGSITERDEADNAVELTFTSAAPGLPQPLTFPLAGTLNTNWSIAAYVDHDPRGDGEFGGPARDYQGGDYTYDTHTGTDVGLANFAAMDRNVPVLSVAAGTVISTDDGHFDRQKVGPGESVLANFVVIDHDNGWHSSYYHLASGAE